MPRLRQLTAAIVCTLAACAGPQTLAASDVPPPAPVSQTDIDVIRGCWVQKTPGDSRVAFLRLLPPHPGATTLEGALLVQSSNPDLLVTNPSRARFAFARDGSSATIDLGASPDATGTGTFTRTHVAWAAQYAPHVAVFTNGETPALYLVVMADDEHLTMATTRHASSDLHLVWAGERDGCD